MPFAVSIYVTTVISKVFLHCYFVYIKLEANSITQMAAMCDCFQQRRHLFSVAMSFVFSGDVCVTMQIMLLAGKCSAVCFALYANVNDLIIIQY